MKRPHVTLILTLASAFYFVGLAGSSKAAGSDFVEGQGLFNQKNYRGAALKFESAMRSTPSDAGVIYYCALANQMANNRARARQLYDYIASNYAATKYAGLASSALKSLGNAEAGGSGISSLITASTNYSAQGSAIGASSYTGPKQFSLPFKRGRFNTGQGGIYLDVLVNNRPMTFHLDTGAHSTVMGANQLDELGLARPAQGEKGFSSGVGEREKIPTWTQKLDLKLGNIYMRDFPVSVHDYYEGEPLLGRDFLRDWDLEINEDSRQVNFMRKGTMAASKPKLRGTIDVPFTLQGRHMIVDAQVNGKNYKFYFDTGADGVCFSMNDLKRLGLEDSIATAQQGYSHGVGGKTLTYIFPISSLKLGPIVKENFTVSAVEQSAMDHPLLGQSFFGSYNVQIDEANKMLHFRSNE